MPKEISNCKLPAFFVDYINDGILIINEEKNITCHNKHAKKILGISLPANKQHNLETKFRQNNQNFLKLVSTSINKNREIKNKEIIYYKKKVERKLLINSMIWYNNHQSSSYTAIIIQDITDIWNTHFLTRKLQTQLRKSFINLLENLRQITDSIAHEMRNPIVAIGGYANYLLKKKNLNDKKTVNKYINNIIEDAERLNNIIKQAEKYSHISEMNFSKENISKIFRNIIKMAKNIALKHSIILEIASFDKGKLEIFLDKEKLTNALTNIIKSTISLAHKDSIVIINLVYNRYDIDFSIEINSAKISDKDIKYIFNPFYSISGKNITFNFTTARRVIILHGGIIKVFRKNNSCISFEINIPKEKRLR